jgi:hypothetical protein
MLTEKKSLFKKPGKNKVQVTKEGLEWENRDRRTYEIDCSSSCNQGKSIKEVRQ